jgi:hypothetical protein
MHLSRFFGRGVLLLALLALAMPLAALADGGKRGNDDCKRCRIFLGDGHRRRPVALQL